MSSYPPPDEGFAANYQSTQPYNETEYTSFDTIPSSAPSLQTSYIEAHRSYGSRGSIGQDNGRQGVNVESLQGFIKPNDDTPWSGGFGAKSTDMQRIASEPIYIANNNPYAASTGNGLPIPASSEISSHGRSCVDSGYHSTQETPITYFNGNRHSIDVAYGGSHLQYPSSANGGQYRSMPPPEPPGSIVSADSITQDHRSGKNGGRRRKNIPNCEDCGKELNTWSDYNKHAQTHMKSFVCTEPECSRSEGFATRNDLERHKKGVHRLKPEVGPSTGYICVLCKRESSKKPQKYWPRKDNFKAHIIRKHKPQTDDEQEMERVVKGIIEESKTEYRPDDAVTAEITIFSGGDSQKDPLDEQGYTMDTVHQNAIPEGLPDVQNVEESLVGFPMSVQIPTILEPHGSPFDFLPMSRMASSQGPSAFLYDSSNYFYGNAKRTRSSDSDGDPYGREPLERGTLFASGSNTSFRGSDEKPPLKIPRHSTNTGQSSTAISDQQEGILTCPDCSKVLRRGCDLKKHRKRHTRPYGCTFPRCFKRFGSRNDWKRHESTQHFLQDQWKCRVGPCTHRPFSSEDHLRQHLQLRHAICDPARLKALSEEFHLGRDGHYHFWCGFHRTPIKQEKNTLNAWERRGKHIGDHFDKEELKIEDWLCVETNRTKGELRHAGQRSDDGYDDYDDDDYDDNDGIYQDWKVENAEDLPHYMDSARRQSIPDLDDHFGRNGAQLLVDVLSNAIPENWG